MADTLIPVSLGPDFAGQSSGDWTLYCFDREGTWVGGSPNPIVGWSWVETVLGGYVMTVPESYGDLSGGSFALHLSSDVNVNVGGPIPSVVSRTAMLSIFRRTFSGLVPASVLQSGPDVVTVEWDGDDWAEGIGIGLCAVPLEYVTAEDKFDALWNGANYYDFGTIVGPVGGGQPILVQATANGGAGVWDELPGGSGTYLNDKLLGICGTGEGAYVPAGTLTLTRTSGPHPGVTRIVIPAQTQQMSCYFIGENGALIEHNTNGLANMPTIGSGGGGGVY